MARWGLGRITVINVETIQLLQNYLVPAPTCHSSLLNNGKSRMIKSSVSDRPNMIISCYLSLTEFQKSFFCCYPEQERRFLGWHCQARGIWWRDVLFLQHLMQRELHWAVPTAGGNRLNTLCSELGLDSYAPLPGYTAHLPSARPWSKKDSMLGLILTPNSCPLLFHSVRI